MKLCVLQGTFNPIHNAHLKMAQYIIDNYKFDKILFIPAHIPPHKACDKNLSIHRLNMVKLAVKDNPNFEVSDIEYKRSGKSYTYLTISELYKKYKITDKINFVIGTDAFEHIESWFEADKLKKLVDFIVFMREDNFKEIKFKNLEGYTYKIAKMDFVDISSTIIREKFKKGEDTSDLIPKNVEEYIKENDLYKY